MGNVLLSMYGGNAAAGVSKPSGSVGMFAGRNAKTADLTALSKAEQLAGQGATRDAIWNALATAGEQPKGITAYHGSPHDFDKFSLDKIGTGEGAQAYGHGLYFADSEGVARSYRDRSRRSELS